MGTSCIWVWSIGGMHDIRGTRFWQHVSIGYWVKMLLFRPSAPALPGIFRTNKKIWEMGFCQRCPKKIFSPFCSASPDIFGVKVCHRQTDRQILWHHIRGYVYFFSQLNLLPPYLLRLQGDKFKFSEFDLKICMLL